MNLIQLLSNYDTSEISDALDACNIEGAVIGIKPVSLARKIIGPAFTVQYASYEGKPDNFKSAADYIDNVPKNSVIVVDNQGRIDCTVWGSILTQVALDKNIAGTIVHGAVRDIELIKKLNYPIYAREVYMRSGKNRVYKKGQQCDLIINNVTIKPGDIVVADSNGVVIVPQARIEEILKKVKNIKKTEAEIINSVYSGMSLQKARHLHRYDQPWLDAKEKGKI